MKINFNQKLYTFDRVPMKEGPREPGKPEPRDATLGFIATGALNGAVEGDAAEGGEAALRRFKLALRVLEATESDTALGALDLNTDEITSIEKRIGKAYPSPVIIGQCHELLNGRPNPLAPKPPAT